MPFRVGTLTMPAASPQIIMPGLESRLGIDQ
jgi:hypothetical protein